MKRFMRVDLRYFEMHVDAIVFFAFVLIGCTYIVFAKLIGIPQLFVTFFPVVLMIGYASLIWFARRLRLREDQAGDNLYYMGFLYTLSSLAVSLYQFTASGGAEAIVRNFGIAIASTIAGVALRVVFNQMRRDPVDVEEVSRLELAEAARRVRRELDTIVLEMTNFRRITQQVISEGYEETKQNIDEIATKIINSISQIQSSSEAPIKKVSNTASTALAEMSGRLIKGIEAAGSKLSSESDRLANSTEEITKAIDALTVGLKGLHAPENIIEIKLSPMVSALERISSIITERDLRQSEKQENTLRELISSRANLAELVSKIKTSAENHDYRNTKTSEQMVSFLENMNDVVSKLVSSASQAIDNQNKSHNVLLHKIDDIVSKLDSDREQRRLADIEISKKVHAALTGPAFVIESPSDGLISSSEVKR